MAFRQVNPTTGAETGLPNAAFSIAPRSQKKVVLTLKPAGFYAAARIGIQASCMNTPASVVYPGSSMLTVTTQ